MSTYNIISRPATPTAMALEETTIVLPPGDNNNTEHEPIRWICDKCKWGFPTYDHLVRHHQITHISRWCFSCPTYQRTKRCHRTTRDCVTPWRLLTKTDGLAAGAALDAADLGRQMRDLTFELRAAQAVLTDAMTFGTTAEVETAAAEVEKVNWKRNFCAGRYDEANHQSFNATHESNLAASCVEFAERILREHG